ncbi:MAG: sialidase family protein [Pirellulales bacterium]
MKTLSLVATLILSQVLDSGTMVTLMAAEKDQANRQGTDARYATTSSIADYVRRAGKPYQGEMRVIRPSALPGGIPCKRIQVGLRMGYKPNVRQLSTGELIMVNFHTHGETQGASDGSVAEHMVIHRSKDNGLTWTSKHVRHVYGREPYLNVLSHDVMLATGHVLASDVNNPTKKVTCVIHRSTDGGTTWKTHPITPGMLPFENLTRTYSSRNIIELPDGTYMLGMSGFHGRDCIMLSKDQGLTWEAHKTTFHGYDMPSYVYSAYQEGLLYRMPEGRLLLFARMTPRIMTFTQEIKGLADLSKLGEADKHFDQFDVEIIFESKDNGVSWDPVNGIPLVGCMYPSVIPLGDHKHLLTFTKRVPGDGLRMGVYATVLTEKRDRSFSVTLDKDLIVIDEKTDDAFQTGGGFGNTLPLDDGSLISVYSYYHVDDDIAQLLKSGKFKEKNVFNYYRNRALGYNPTWVAGCSEQSYLRAGDRLKRHMFLGCCQLLNLCGPVTEVAKWDFPN